VVVIIRIDALWHFVSRSPNLNLCYWSTEIDYFCERLHAIITRLKESLEFNANDKKNGAE
jgi:hypothetical protein